MFVKAGGAASPATRVIDDAHRPAILLARGLEGVGLAEFEDQEVAAAPIPIYDGGKFSFYMRYCVSAQNEPEMVSFGIRFMNLCKSVNGVDSIRYDKNVGAAKGMPDFDEDILPIGDAPSHPVCHVHVNYAVPNHINIQADNDLRLPAGDVDPILVVRSVDHWYCRRLGILR